MYNELGVMVHALSLRTQNGEAGRVWIWVQPRPVKSCANKSKKEPQCLLVIQSNKVIQLKLYKVTVSLWLCHKCMMSFDHIHTLVPSPASGIPVHFPQSFPPLHTSLCLLHVREKVLFVLLTGSFPVIAFSSSVCLFTYSTSLFFVIVPIDTTFPLSVHPMMDTQAVSRSWLSWAVFGGACVFRHPRHKTMLVLWDPDLDGV